MEGKAKKILASPNKNTSQGEIIISSIPPACYHITLLVGMPESSGGRIISPLSTSSLRYGSPCSHITWWMNNWPIGGRSSET
jgi:hypothetical protein